MASHDYYGFSHAGTIGQYSGYGVSNAAYSQSASQSSAGYGVGQQQTAQYGPYGNRIQAYDTQQSSYLSAMTSGSSGYGAVASGYGHASADVASVKYPTQTAYYQAQAETPSYYTQLTGQKSAGSKNEARASEWQSFGSSSSQKKASHNISYSTTTSAEMSGLDKALYAIAANYCQSQAGQRTGRGGAGGGNATARSGGAMWWNKKGRMPVDPSEWKYCELCKMTCPGEQAYKLHLEGKVHKKKEASVSRGGGSALATQQTFGRSGAFCEVCDVSCSSKDAYEAHIRGIKHQKVVKLMTRMGKTVPESQPLTITSVTQTKTATATTSTSAGANTSALKKVYCTPKINFVGGTQLKTTGGGQMEEVTVKRDTAQSVSVTAAASTQQAAPEEGEVDDSSVQPIGMEYIEEGMNDAGTAPSFFCKLCDCHFTDIMGKIMHAKGRRHRFAYKKKVDPSLKVDMKVNTYDRRAVLEKLKRSRNIPEQWRKREIEATYRMEAEELRYEKEVLEWKLQEAAGSRYAPPLTQSIWSGPQPGIGPQPAFNGTIERAIQAKHVSIYPTMQELGSVQKMVAAVEKSLKSVSDQLAIQDNKKNSDTGTENTVDAKIVQLAAGDTQPRMMKGVMRVGLLCKGLLLHGNLNLHLVVLCGEKPTRSLVLNIAELLPAQLANALAEELELTTDGSDIFISRKLEPFVICAISLTSASVKTEGAEEAAAVSEPADVLDKDKCIQLLAELRHAKWFQAKVTPMPTYLVVIRILMDHCCREPAWSPVSQWALELLVEKCASTIEGGNHSASSILLRVFECVASGLLLEDGPSIYDVCEKEPTDALEYMTAQQREDITTNAQHTLRQMLFGQTELVFPVIKQDSSEPTGEVSSSGGSDVATTSQCKRPRISST